MAPVYSNSKVPFSHVKTYTNIQETLPRVVLATTRCSQPRVAINNHSLHLAYCNE